MKLTIRAIIKWELLNQKPFSQINYGNEDDVVSLFYLCLGSDDEMLLSDFKQNLTDERLKEMAKGFEKQILIASQFKTSSKQGVEESETSDPVYIKDIIPILIMNGLDVHYALSEMELYDIPIFLNGYDQKIRNKLESSRLWTFMQLSPHLSKNIKSPKDLYPFSWEIEEQKERSKDELEKGVVLFESFMESGIK